MSSSGISYCLDKENLFSGDIVKLTQTILDEEAYSSLQLYAKNCTDEDAKELYNYLHHVKNQCTKSNDFLKSQEYKKELLTQFYWALGVMITIPIITVFFTIIAAKGYPLAPHLTQAYQEDPNIKLLDTHWKLTDVHQELSNAFGMMRDRYISMPLIPVKDHYNQLKAKAVKLREIFVIKRYATFLAPIFAAIFLYMGNIFCRDVIRQLMQPTLDFEPIVDSEKQIERVDYLLTALQLRIPSLAGSV
jgi:hypothetical protein